MPSSARPASQTAIRSTTTRCNEKGLGMAGLNFVGNAAYAAPCAGKRNVAQFEFIPWLLGRCAGLAEARAALAELNLVGTPFSAHFPAAQLHWLVADRTGALVVESMADGLHVYDCPEGVLTNNPPFPIQHFGLNRYLGLSPRQPENRFSDQLELSAFSRGMGALGLPGDLSSGSRFVRAAFVRANSRSGESEAARVGQFFHILGAVEQQKGCCEVRPGEFEHTIYTSCWNAQRGIYYYTTYSCRQIHAVDMHRENLDSTSLARYPMQTDAADPIPKLMSLFSPPSAWMGAFFMCLDAAERGKNFFKKSDILIVVLMC